MEESEGESNQQNYHPNEQQNGVLAFGRSTVVKEIHQADPP
jgi:hypothetical protein